MWCEPLRTGRPATITVVGPAARWNKEAMTKAAPSVLLQCEHLSAELGSLSVGIG
jgi:hypothetical protein